ncbi:MAG: SIMPL domain-containing protein [Flavobacteriales bacterium]|nr:SIMPL domain-containing protein [Flavobacteriales bacterium]
MKNLNINPIYIIVGVLALVAFRSPNDHQNTNKLERVITVTGSADMLVPPDEILVDISYREYWFQHQHKNKGKESINKIEKGIIKAVNDIGIGTENITINSEFTWKYRHDYWSYWYHYNNTLKNTLLQKNLTVKLSSSTQLNKLMQKLKENNIRREGVVNITLNGSSNKNIQKYRKMVKKRAMEAAQEKADYLLAALGEKCGVVITVQELSDSKRTKTTTHHGGYPYYDRVFGWYGGYGGTTTTNNGGMNAISNSSVSMPSGGGKPVSKDENDLSMKPIKLRYEIQAQFTIVPR